ncbi:866_t:CDS:2, partial [Acaulospora morrowiae]
ARVINLQKKVMGKNSRKGDPDIPYQPLMEEKLEDQIRTRSSTDDSEDLKKRSHLHFDDPVLKQVEETTKVTTFVYVATFVISIGGFMFGYDTGVISSAMLLLENDFTMTALQKGMVVGATTLGAIFGGLTSGSFSDFVGRRMTSLVAAIIFIGGALILSLASSYELLLFGRLVVGIAAGASSQIVPIYISEISPRFYRGRLVTVNILMCTGGQLFAYLIAAGFVFQGGWRWMFGVSGIPPAIQLICMIFIPESPRYLVRKGKIEQAKRILAKIYPGAYQTFLSQEIEIIQETIAQNATGSYKKLFKYPNLGPLIISCGLQLFQQLSGFDTAMYYGA